MQRKEDTLSSPITSSLCVSDIWNNIMKILSPQECIKLSFVSKAFKALLKKEIKSPLRAIFVVSCHPCGSRIRFHVCDPLKPELCLDKTMSYPIRERKEMKNNEHQFKTTEILNVKHLDYNYLYRKNQKTCILYIEGGVFTESLLQNTGYHNQSTPDFSFMIETSSAFIKDPHRHLMCSDFYIPYECEFLYLFWEKDYHTIESKTQLINKFFDDTGLYKPL